MPVIKTFSFSGGDLCRVDDCDDDPFKCCLRCTVVIGDIDITDTAMPATMGPGGEDVSGTLYTHVQIDQPFTFCSPCNRTIPEGTETYRVSALCDSLQNDPSDPPNVERWKIIVDIACNAQNPPLAIYGEANFTKGCEEEGVFSGTVEVRDSEGAGNVVCNVPYTVTCPAPCFYRLTEFGDTTAYTVTAECVDGDTLLKIKANDALFDSDQINFEISDELVPPTFPPIFGICPASPAVGADREIEFTLPGDFLAINVICENTNSGDGSGGGEAQCVPRPNTTAQYGLRSSLLIP